MAELGILSLYAMTQYSQRVHNTFRGRSEYISILQQIQSQV